MTRVVIAPDSFKGTASAADAAAALAAGWRAVRPDDILVERPMADGGEGTLDAFASAGPGARRMPVTVRGPVSDPVEAWWLLLPDGTGVVELAATSGITLLDPLAPLEAHTEGFGEAIGASSGCCSRSAAAPPPTAARRRSPRSARGSSTGRAARCRSVEAGWPRSPRSTSPGSGRCRGAGP